MRDVPCPTCGGARLKPEVLAVTIDGRNIAEVCALSVGECADLLGAMTLTDRQKMIAERVLKEINARLRFLVDVGLDYLSLDRPAGTLSGGEAQRIRLATQIGSGLVGVLYVLDEPTIGLHQRDNHRLIETLVRLQEPGQHADRGRARRGHHPHRRLGGRHRPGRGRARRPRSCTAARSRACSTNKESITGAYLSGRREIPTPEDPPAAATPGASSSCRAPASTTCRT